jgi:hypothetical protein
MRLRASERVPASMVMNILLTQLVHEMPSSLAVFIIYNDTSVRRPFASVSSSGITGPSIKRCHGVALLTWRRDCSSQAAGFVCTDHQKGFVLVVV